MRKIYFFIIFILPGVYAQAKDPVNPSDYSLAENWLKIQEDPLKKADVFYIYPVCRKGGEGEPAVCPIDHAEMRATAKIVYQLQATAFDSLANVYAPFYRQLDAQTIMRARDYKARFNALDGETVTDIIASFDYFIKHYNKGRPFILVGHSEGAMLVKKLLFGYMREHPEVYSRMVAAYVIGYSITGDELAANPHLRFASGSGDTGVVISYNTEAPGLKFPNPTAEKGAVAINPLSWRRDTITVSAMHNRGSYIYRRGTYVTVPYLADARLDSERGTIICSTVSPKEYISAYGLFPEGIYHSFDFAFYYYDLRVNAAERIINFLNKER
jgi:hypothetical protein